MEGGLSMNKQRRAKLATIQEQLSDLVLRLEEIRDEEQEALDALPDSFREGDKGQAMEMAISALEDAINEMQGIDSYLDSAME
jgi:hypothetical protein